MKKYESLNFINFESLLTPEQKAIRNSVRKFVDDEVLPLIQNCANRIAAFN